MEYVYVLHHSYELDGHEETKLIGIYSTRQKAKKTAKELSVQPGFNLYPDCFVINKHKIDKDNWTEGFKISYNICVSSSNKNSDNIDYVIADFVKDDIFRVFMDFDKQEISLKAGQLIRCKKQEVFNEVNEYWFFDEILSDDK